MFICPQRTKKAARHFQFYHLKDHENNSFLVQICLPVRVRPPVLAWILRWWTPQYGWAGQTTPATPIRSINIVWLLLSLANHYCWLFLYMLNYIFYWINLHCSPRTCICRWDDPGTQLVSHLLIFIVSSLSCVSSLSDNLTIKHF